MSLINKVIQIAEEIAKITGYAIDRKDNVIFLSCPDSPFKLQIKVNVNVIEFSLVYEGLEDYVDELIDSGEDVREAIEYEISDVKNIARRIKSKLKELNVNVIDRIKEAELDVYDIVEEYLS